MNIIINERDKEMFELLYRLRYASSKQICKYFDWSYSAFRNRISQLIKCSYIESTFVERINNKVYSNGIEVRRLHERKSYRDKVKINNYTMKHHLEINNVYIFLTKVMNYDKESIVTEREVYWQKTGFTTKNIVKKKVPDMVIKREQNGKERLIALEIETTQKNETYFKDVFRSFKRNTNFWGITYLCKTKAIKELVNKTAKKLNYNYIMGIMLDEFYKGEDFIGF